MYYVYVLVSLKDRRFYVGSSEDLRKRFREHQDGRVASTRGRLPLKLICYEAYLTKYDALRRERYLKSSDAKKEFRVRFKGTLQILIE